MARLGDVCTISSSSAPILDNQIWLLNLDMVEQQTGNIISYNYVGNGELNGSIVQFDTDNVLYSKLRPNLNKVVIPDRSGFATSEMLPLKPNTSVLCREYLAAYLRSDSFVSWAVSKTAGAKMPRLGTKVLLDKEIPLPPLEEQHRIAALLDKVSDLIAKRRAQLDKLDLLVKARFVEMFGDSETNPMKLPMLEIGAVIKTIDSGWSGNGKQRKKKAGEIAVLKVSAVTKGYFIPEECKVLDDQENIKKYVFPQKGDLLFSRANTKEMVGATAIIREDYPELILPDKLWKIRFSGVTNVVYMKYILSSKAIRNKFSEASTGTSGSMYNVSMEKFKAIQIPMPEIGIQNQFASFAESVEKSKLTIRQSLDKLEVLKKALIQQYFR